MRTVHIMQLLNELNHILTEQRNIDLRANTTQAGTVQVDNKPMRFPKNAPVIVHISNQTNLISIGVSFIDNNGEQHFVLDQSVYGKAKNVDAFQDADVQNDTQYEVDMVFEWIQNILKDLNVEQRRIKELTEEIARIHDRMYRENTSTRALP